MSSRSQTRDERVEWNNEKILSAGVISPLRCVFWRLRTKKTIKLEEKIRTQPHVQRTINFNFWKNLRISFGPVLNIFQRLMKLDPSRIVGWEGKYCVVSW